MTVVIILIIVVVVLLLGAASAVRILKQYERGVLFRLGRVRGDRRGPGLIAFVPLIDRLHRVSLRIVTMPIQSQGIITRDNVSVDVSAVAYYRVADPIRSVVAIENVSTAINQIAQTTLRAVVGRHTLDETLSETDTINQNIREILDVQTEEWDAGHARRVAGHPAAGEHEARDGPAGRGRAGEAREDHRRRRRVG